MGKEIVVLLSVCLLNVQIVIHHRCQQGIAQNLSVPNRMVLRVIAKMITTNCCLLRILFQMTNTGLVRLYFGHFPRFVVDICPAHGILFNNEHGHFCYARLLLIQFRFVVLLHPLALFLCRFLLRFGSETANISYQLCGYSVMERN